MNKLIRLLEKFGIEKKNLKQFLIFVVGIFIALIILINTHFFSTIGPIILVVLFGIFFTFLWFVAGYAVFRSLLVASVGLSFIIFIGQSYCALPINDQVADSSLMTLIGFGFIYVITQFGRSLYKELFGDRQAKEEWRQKGIVKLFKEANHNKHSWFILLIYGLWISLFVWQIYSVINPVIHGLCVYK